MHLPWPILNSIFIDEVAKLLADAPRRFWSAIYDADVEEYIFKLKNRQRRPNGAGHQLPCERVASRSSTRARTDSKSSGLDKPRRLCSIASSFPSCQRRSLSWSSC